MFSIIDISYTENGLIVFYIYYTFISKGFKKCLYYHFDVWDKIKWIVFFCTGEFVFTTGYF